MPTTGIFDEMYWGNEVDVARDLLRAYGYLNKAARKVDGEDRERVLEAMRETAWAMHVLLDNNNGELEEGVKQEEGYDDDFDREITDPTEF